MRKFLTLLTLGASAAIFAGCAARATQKTSSPTPVASPTVVIVSPNSEAITEQNLLGQIYINYCASGETGVFKPNGVVELSFGRDYILNDTRPSKGTGKWSVTDGTLHLSKTSLSDGDYKDFLFKTVEGKQIIADKVDGCSIVIGPDEQTINKYINSLLGE